MAAQYKVMTINAGCCGNVSPKSIEKVCTDMSATGFRLVVAYEANVGACCQGKAAVLVFSSE